MIGFLALKLYHVATYSNAERILADGFHDPQGSLGLIAEEALWRPYSLKGVTFLQRPTRDRDRDTAILVIDPPEEVIAQFELIEEDEQDVKEGYREWCIPAEVANRYFTDRTIYHASDLA